MTKSAWTGLVASAAYALPLGGSGGHTCNTWFLGLTRKVTYTEVYEYSNWQCDIATPLRELTCHVGSHTLFAAAKAGTRFSDPGETQDCVSISTDSAVLSQLMVVFDSQTTPTTSVTIGRIDAPRAQLEQVINMFNCYNICRCIPMDLFQISVECPTSNVQLA